MTLTEAVEILKRHNEWRREGGGGMASPKDLGIAIDIIVEHYEGVNDTQSTCM